MPKQDDGSSLLGALLAIAGGAIFVYAIAKALSGGQEHYDCPNCHNTFAGKQAACPYCRVRFKW